MSTFRAAIVDIAQTLYFAGKKFLGVSIDPGSTRTDDLLISEKAAKDYADSVGGGATYFLGVYTSLVALQTAHPTATPGDYAQVDGGPGTDVIQYNWDTDEGWVPGGSGSVIPPATESVAGIAEIATTAEVNTGTDDDRIVTPLKLKQVTDALDVQINVSSAGNKLFLYYNFK